MKVRLYLFMERENDSLYAWTENKEIAKLFRITRSTKFFREEKRKYNLDSDEDEWEYAVFRREYGKKTLFMNVLGQMRGDSVEFPTTYWENAVLEEYCDKIYDHMIAMSRKLCMFPLTEEAREPIERLAFFAAKNGEKLHIDSYRVFTSLFKETIL